MKKRRWIAISVTTFEAMRKCMDEHCSAICIEEPLYHEIKYNLSKIEGISDYKATYYHAQKIIILKKIYGQHPFDDEHFELFHYLLHNI